MTRSRTFISLGLCGLLAGCQTNLSDISATVTPRVATYSCSEGVMLTVRRNGDGVSVSDSREIDVDLPANPPGQSVRFAEGIYALIVENGEATWFVSGKVPVECRR